MYPNQGGGPGISRPLNATAQGVDKLKSAVDVSHIEKNSQNNV